MAGIASALGLGSPGSAAAVQAQLLSGLIAGSTPVPTLGNLTYQNFTTPEDIQYLGDVNISEMSPSELRNILTDPRLMESQMGTLSELDQVVAGGGLSAIDRARLNEVRAEQAAMDRGQRDAILQNAAMRGMRGSGMELAQQLQAQQASANQAAQESAQVAAQAQQARLQAAMQRAGLAGEMQGRSFNQQAMQGQAQDAINQFNTANRNAGAVRNMDTRQGISAQNVINRNQTNQQNTAMQNQANYYNTVTRPMSQYGMQSGQMGAMAGGLQNAANMQNQNAAAQFGANAQLTGALIGTAGQVGAGFSGRPTAPAQQGAVTGTSDRNAKENVQKADFDVEKFLQNLVPVKYNYKLETGLDTSPRIGIIAQDLEKSKMGSELVQNGSEYKQIDLLESIPKILASLGYLNKKLEERTG